MSENKNCLSYWLPKLLDAGLPVPKTHIVHTCVAIEQLLDGIEPEDFDVFLAMITASAKMLGYPCFLRTGQGSGKHRWKDTCFLRAAADLPSHVAALVEWSHAVDFLGLPTDVWCVRELLPTKPIATLPMYGDMPLCREFRCFVRDADVICIHHYWPELSVAQGFPPASSPGGLFKDYVYAIPDGVRAAWEQMCELTADERREVGELASRTGAAVGGDWSVDILDTERGFFVTDMAEAARSYHWEGCELMAGHFA